MVIDDVGASKRAQRARLLRGIFPGETCTLVPLDFVHSDRVVAWRNDPAISRWFLSPRQFEKEAHEAWLTRTLQFDTDVNWVIQDHQARPIGTIALYDIDWKAGVAEFGRLLIGEPQARGKGFARSAVLLVLSAARDAEIRELRLEVKLSNTAARALYESIGFVEVGRDDVCIKMLMLIANK